MSLYGDLLRNARRAGDRRGRAPVARCPPQSRSGGVALSRGAWAEMASCRSAAARPGSEMPSAALISCRDVPAETQQRGRAVSVRGADRAVGRTRIRQSRSPGQEGESAPSMSGAMKRSGVAQAAELVTRVSRPLAMLACRHCSRSGGGSVSRTRFRRRWSRSICARWLASVLSRSRKPEI